MLFLRLNLADQQSVGDASKPSRPKLETLHASEEQSQSRVQGNGQDGGGNHREVLRVRKRLEEPAFLRFEREHGKERDRDHEQREEAWAADFFYRLNDDAAIRL